jgi:hypothetical protein
VAPNRWRFTYTDDDHHLKENRSTMEFPTVSEEGDNWEIHWGANVTLEDKNGDDDYDWRQEFTVVGIHDSYIVYRYRGPRTSYSGGPHTYNESFSDEKLKNFTQATVVLVGWRFGFWETDHHIKQMGIRLTNVTFDKAQGRINWKVRQTFSDKNGDDDYYWSYQYAVVAFNGGAAGNASATSEIAPSAACDPSLIDTPVFFPNFTEPVSPAFAKRVVLLQGWTYEPPYGGMGYDDVHLKRNNFWLEQYWTSSGLAVRPRVRFGPLPVYIPELEGDCFVDFPKLTFDVTLLAFERGVISFVSSNDKRSNGGWDDREYSVQVPRLSNW